jgi:hypothetical protein
MQFVLFSVAVTITGPFKMTKAQQLSICYYSTAFFSGTVTAKYSDYTVTQTTTGQGFDS